MSRNRLIPLFIGTGLLAAAIVLVSVFGIPQPVREARPEVTSRSIAATSGDGGALDAQALASARAGSVARSAVTKVPRPDAAQAAAPVVRQVAVKGSASVLRANAGRLRLRVVRAIRPLGIVVVEPLDSAETAEDLAFRLRRSGLVSSAEPGKPMSAMFTPNDPLFTQQWGYQNTGQSGGTPGSDANVVPAWDWSRGDGVVVAVLDTGIDFSAPDLAGQQWVNAAETPGNGIDDDGNGFVDDVNGFDFLRGEGTVFDLADGDIHGTHVAGTIAARTNEGYGGAGMATGARLMSTKFLGAFGGSDLDAAAGVVYAVDNGADVINASFGGSSYSTAFLDAVHYAAGHGVLIVCAAGNDAVNTDTSARYPASFTATNIVSVAALDRVDALPSYSNRGAVSVDLGAPGSGVLSTLPPKLPSGLLVDASTYKAVYLPFPLESVTSTDTRRQMTAAAMAELATETANPVLLVDDAWQSRSTAYEPAGWRRMTFLSDLSALGYSDVTTWRTETSGTPPASVMAGKTVVWFTGACTFEISSVWSTTCGTLLSAERTQLGTFLNGGGRLLISSGDLAEEMRFLGTMSSGMTWFRSYLHARYVSSDPTTGELRGEPGTMFDGISATVDDTIRYSDVSDEVAPNDASATVLSTWTHEHAAKNGTSMAAPHVTGAVALLMSRVPTMTGTAAKARLLATTDPVSSLSGLCVTGGRLDAASLVGTSPAPAPLKAWPVASGTLQLGWVNPSDADFVATRLLARVDAPPAGPEDASATVLYDGDGSTAEHSGLTSGTVVHYAAYARGTYGAWSEAAELTATVTDPPPGVLVPVGTDVTVSYAGVTLSFSKVTAPGWLSVTRKPAAFGAPVGMMWVGDDYYDIHPVGVFAVPVDFTLPYDGSAVRGNESDLRLYHRVGDGWDDVTVSVDTAANVVHARTASFSDFGLGEPLGGPNTQADAASTGVEAAIGLAVLGFMGMRARRRHRT